MQPWEPLLFLGFIAIGAVIGFGGLAAVAALSDRNSRKKANELHPLQLRIRNYYKDHDEEVI